ncbi:MAG TPA: DMT family transporter [Anaerolineales bacterium]|nr:DMT family transporter [Anaerolineales bacterium]HNA87732.1 DMT family transporter [Anaerolineales bacterium]HNB34689.1 DMT family transporter [Anaerolineales bacterium]HNC07737.1 DMT family transporter [Anaerolineales bacterium]
MDSKTRLILPFALGIATLAVSTASIFIRFAQGDGAPSLVIAALRITIATLLISPVALTRYRDEIKRFSRTEVLLGAASGIFLAVHFATWITSLEYTSVASSVVFVGTGPLWVALLSPMLLKEHITRTTVMGLVLAVLGGSIIGLSDACTWNGSLSCPAFGELLQGRAMWGNFLALMGAWAVTGYLIIGRKLRAGTSLVPYIFLVYGMAAVTLMIMLLIANKSIFGYDAKTYGWIFLLAAIPQLIGHTTYNWTLKYLPATMVAVTVLGEPIGSATLAYFILNEIPSTLTIIGGILILLGIIFASKNK